MIAFLGMGLLGSNFVRRLLEAGEGVHVWNRTPDRACALEGEGARAFDDPAQAVRGAARVHLTLSDDAAVDDVLERTRAGLKPDVVLVDHTTTSPAGTAARVARWKQRGIRFLHAPVFMAPVHARSATGIMLASGERSLFDSLQPFLAKMTGKLVYFGPEPERAAVCKLLGNMFTMFVVSGLADVLALATAQGVSHEQVRELLSIFNPGAQLDYRMKRIIDGDFANPSWTLAMARKDVRLMLEGATAPGVSLSVLPAIAKVMDQWIEQGHAGDDWTIIGRDALPRP